jgi:3-oxoacyl-[acyl-carrier protein] reductase
MHAPAVSDSNRPVALVTGVGRQAGIGAAIVHRLAADGWDIAFTYWSPYDRRMPWGRDKGEQDRIAEGLTQLGARVLPIEADLEDPAAPAQIFDRLTLGQPRALIMAHCESVDSGLLDTTIESFDRHFAVNARATWLLIREFAKHTQADGLGRIIALTSDATVGNLPYGASKGALDRITIAAAKELKHLGITADRHRLDGRRSQGSHHRGHPAWPAWPAHRLRQPGRLPLLAGRRLGQWPANPQRRRDLTRCGLQPHPDGVDGVMCVLLCWPFDCRTIDPRCTWRPAAALISQCRLRRAREERHNSVHDYHAAAR